MINECEYMYNKYIWYIYIWVDKDATDLEYYAEEMKFQQQHHVHSIRGGMH